jgi:hypothetical protein
VPSAGQLWRRRVNSFSIRTIFLSLTSDWFSVCRRAPVGQTLPGIAPGLTNSQCLNNFLIFLFSAASRVDLNVTRQSTIIIPNLASYREIMPLSDKSKVLLWTIFSSSLYFVGLFGILGLIDVSKNSVGTSQDFIPTILYLIAFPFLQYFLSRKLKSSGNLQAWSGIKRSIFIEIVLLILLFIMIVYVMGP